jgi:hypothetical protein
MSRSISMTAFSRPDYTLQALYSIAQTQGSCEWPFFASVDGVDHPDRDTVLLHQCHAVREVFRSRRPGFPGVHFQEERLGCDANTLQAIQTAFSAGSDFNLHVEDDTVLSPDALELCDWFYRYPKRDDYACLCLHSLSHDESHPLELVEASTFCAWGWAITREMWERWFLPEWCAKKHHPRGWDWSMSLTMQKHGLKCLHPVLSRVKNIGRDQGEYETPEHHDEWTKGLVQSRGWHGDFGVTEFLTDDFAQHQEQWYLDELKAEAEASAKIQNRVD